MSHVPRRTSPTRPHQRATVYLYERYTLNDDAPPRRALAVTASGSYSATDIARALFTTQRPLPFKIARLVNVSLLHNTDLPVPLTPASIRASSGTAVLFGQSLHPDDAPDALNVVLANPAAFRAKGAGPVYEFRYTPLDDAPPLETHRLASITSPRLPSFDIVPFVQEHGTCWVHAAFHMLAAAAPLPVHTDTPLCRRVLVSPRSRARAQTRHTAAMHSLARSVRGATDLDAGGKPEDTARVVRDLLPSMFADIPHIVGSLVSHNGDITLYAKPASPAPTPTAPAAAVFLASTRTPSHASVIAPPFRIQADEDYSPPPRTLSLHGTDYTLLSCVLTTRHSRGEYHVVAGVYHRSTPYILNSWADTPPVAYDWTRLDPDDILVDNVAIRDPVAYDYMTAHPVGLRPYLKIHGISALLYIRSDIRRPTTPRMTSDLSRIVFPQPPSSGGRRSRASQKKKSSSS